MRRTLLQIICATSRTSRDGLGANVCAFSTAMHLLQSGVPFNVIAVWLGHGSMNTTHRYIEVNLSMKEKALARLEPTNTKMRKFHALDAFIRFLQSL